MVGGALHDDYHNRFLKGATDCAIERGYTLTIGLTEGDSELERKMLSSFQQMMVDGYLVFHSVNAEAYRSLQQQGVPFVLYTKYFENLDCDHVVCDDVLGGGIMTRHLISCGHERIAFVYDKGLKDSSEVKNRIVGYKQALVEAGIPLTNRCCCLITTASKGTTLPPPIRSWFSASAEKTGRPRSSSATTWSLQLSTSLSSAWACASRRTSPLAVTRACTLAPFSIRR
jgi:DNA-binding LacI/PurR family transcriptional regulator